MTDYQPLNSPEEDGFVSVPRERLQYALDLLQERKYGSRARSPGHNAQLVIEGLLHSKIETVPAIRPTPEAERPALVGGEDGLRALPAKWRHFVRTVLGQGPSGAAMLECARELEAALSQDGGMLPDELDAVSAEWYSLCERAAYVEKIKISGELAEAIVKTICRLNSTPNAIRGDKGAEAVYAIAGYIDYLRYDKAVKYADPTNVAVQTLRLSIAEDLERIASPAAPTQAAAKDTP